MASHTDKLRNSARRALRNHILSYYPNEMPEQPRNMHAKIGEGLQLVEAYWNGLEEAGKRIRDRLRATTDPDTIDDATETADWFDQQLDKLVQADAMEQASARKDVPMSL